jgi:hypothetical protein
MGLVFGWQGKSRGMIIAGRPDDGTVCGPDAGMGSAYPVILVDGSLAIHSIASCSEWFGTATLFLHRATVALEHSCAALFTDVSFFLLRKIH